VSWSLLTVHITPAIALQLMREVIYRSLETFDIKEITKHHISKVSGFRVLENPNNLVQIS